MCGRGCFKINNERVSITSFTESRAMPVGFSNCHTGSTNLVQGGGHRAGVEGQADAPAVLLGIDGTPGSVQNWMGDVGT